MVLCYPLGKQFNQVILYGFYLEWIFYIIHGCNCNEISLEQEVGKLNVDLSKNETKVQSAVAFSDWLLHVTCSM